ncbi:hypothetical protein CFP56_000234 [Quercus suber]|uniref:Uncharacterized protein n=1 Tax=Quercus suber TaxID=58331 RepID=A0AAW0MCZ7_QUESU
MAPMVEMEKKNSPVSSLFFVQLGLSLFWVEIVAELYMPLLFVRDCDSGDGFGVGQSPNSCYGVVYFSDSLNFAIG